MKTIGIFLFSIISFFSYAQDAIYLTNPKLFTELIDSDTFSLTALSSNKFVIAYDDGEKGKVLVGNIQNDTVLTFGYPRTFNSGTSLNGVEVTRLSNNRFLLTFSTNYGTRIQVFEVSEGNSISNGQTFTLKDDYYNRYSQITLSENKFLIAYYDAESGYGKCALGEINEDLDISIDSIYSFTNSTISNTSYISVDTLSNSKFVIAYGYFGGKAIVGSVDDNNEITFGNSYNFSSNRSIYIDVVGLNENRFAIIYSDGYYPMKGTVILGTTDENKIITYSDKYFFNDLETRGISAARLSSDEIVIAFNNRDNNNGYLIKTKIVGDSLNFAQEVMHNNSVRLNSDNQLSSLDNQRFLVLYPVDNSYNGFVRLCSTVEFDMTNSINQNHLLSHRIYPNPTNDNLFIKIDNETKDNIVRIYDLQGRLLLENKFDSNEISLNLSSYQKGTYLIQILNKNNQLTRKIIVE